MSIIWSDKKLLSWKIFMITLVIMSGFIYITIISIFSLFEPLDISYISYLSKTAQDINEKTDFIQSGPDTEYRYFMKAKVTEEEFLEFTKELKLECASPINRCVIPYKKSGLPWWNPPSASFLFAKGNGADYCVQADYMNTTGYMYLYVVQN